MLYRERPELDRVPAQRGDVCLDLRTCLLHGARSVYAFAVVSISGQERVDAGFGVTAQRSSAINHAINFRVFRVIHLGTVLSHGRHAIADGILVGAASLHGAPVRLADSTGKLVTVYRHPLCPYG